MTGRSWPSGEERLGRDRDERDLRSRHRDLDGDRTDAAPRYAHSATLLPDGRVLVVGGWSVSGANALLSAEVYTPATRRWAAAGPLHVARAGHTATLLTNGCVLVAGGRDRAEVTPTAEEYDPATDSWSLTAGPLQLGRDGHTATLLKNGTVLVAGGRLGTDQVTGSSEVYDPASRTWHPVGAMGVARADHQATLLPGRTVLAFGGLGNGLDLDSAEAYDAATGARAPAPAMQAPPGAGASATLLSDGRVLSTGGARPSSTTPRPGPGRRRREPA